MYDELAGWRFCIPVKVHARIHHADYLAFMATGYCIPSADYNDNPSLPACALKMFFYNKVLQKRSVSIKDAERR